MPMPNPAGPIRRAIDGATNARTITGDEEVGTAPKTIEERLPYECRGCGARYAGKNARDPCCGFATMLAEALER